MSKGFGFLAVILGICILGGKTSIPLAAHQKDCREQCSQIREEIEEFKQQKDISDKFYEKIDNFIKDKEKAINKRTLTVEEYNNFPDEYIYILQSYPNARIEELNMLFLEKEYRPENAKPYIEEFNNELIYIEKELSIYGVYSIYGTSFEKMKLTYDDFPVLEAKG
ncbi:MAG: hypothetical protein HFJ53_07040 [Clostridia bacterium]|uniref:hypothetical protein n=1 Tax=Romboutsia ilealis TaxID=1115758 RepID=UPI0026F3FED9|nr:hypothetical protein [Romboutsia ilealis]MCI9016900.1 hypothetical protein [Clostridia bacterium]